MITKQLPTKNTVTSHIRHYEELNDGTLIPIYQPSCVCPNIKTRKFSELVKRHHPLKDLVAYLEKDSKIIGLRNLNVGKTVDDKLLSVTHQIIVLTGKDGSEKEFLIPRGQMTSFRQVSFSYIKLTERSFFKCVSNRNQIMVLKFKYTTTDDFNTTFHFTVFNIDKVTFNIRKHEDSLIIDAKENEMKFNILMKNDQLIFVWPYQEKVTLLDFNDDVMNFHGFPLKDNLSSEYYVKMINGFLSVTTIDPDFMDSVFSIKDTSKRVTTYYNVLTGKSFNTKKALLNIAELAFFEHPTDVIYFNSCKSNQPRWLVTEWALPELALGKIFICGVSDGCVTNMIKEFDFTQIFMEYKTFFRTPNEKQQRYTINYFTSQLFLWSSDRHIIVVNLETHGVDYILELDTTKYKDFKSEFFEFSLQVSLDGHCIDVIIKKNQNIVHLEQFRLPPPKRLEEQAKIVVMNTYPEKIIENSNLKFEIKNDLLLGACC